MSTYENFGSRLGPPWLQRTNALAVTRALHAQKDDMKDRARQAVLANLPGVGPADALPDTGQERMLPRAVGESDDDYAERLRVCWDRNDGWKWAGTYRGLLGALVRAGLPDGSTGVNILQTTQRYAYWNGTDPVYATGHLWTFDDPRLWNRFGVVVGQDVTGLDVGTPLARTVLKTIALWKPAKALCKGVWVMVSGVAWGWPIGITWGQGGLNWGAAGDVRFIPYV